jgi:hypothetical protein
MKRVTYLGQLSLALGLGVTAVVLTMVGFSSANAAGQVDLTLDMKAPRHVAPSSTFKVNIAYANIGTEDAPGAWVTATLPGGTQFITATDRWGAPLPPDVSDGDELAWNVGPLPAGSCCRHIFITEWVSEELAEGETLTNSAVIATSVVESDTTNNQDSAVSLVCAMAGSAKRVHAREVMPGDVLTYTIQLKLARRHGMEWVQLTDTLPFSHQVRFLGWTGTVTGAQRDRQTLRWQGHVRAGEPFTLQYRLGVEGVVTPGTSLTNVAHLGWAGGHLQLGPVTTVVTLPHYARMIGPDGHTWRHQHGVTLTVPPQAVSETTRFHFHPLFTDTQPVAGPPGWMFAHRAFDLAAFRFGENIRQFNRPLTITVGYSDTDVAGLKRETLRLWYREGPGEPWAMLGDPVRVMSGSLSFTTTHLTQFALFAEAGQHVYLPLVTR